VFQTPFQRIYLERSGSVRGMVRSFMKAPVPGIRVYLKPSPSHSIFTPEEKVNSPSPKKQITGSKKNKKADKFSSPAGMSTRTDARGRFVFNNLKPESYEICIGNPKHPVSKSKTVRIAPGEHSSSSFVLKELGNLDVRVMKDSGFFVKSLVTLSGGAGDMMRKVQTDSIGVAEFKNMVPGKYLLVITSKGHKTSKKKITLHEGPNPSMNVYLTEKK
jgi:hypothetical protein